MLRSTGNLPVKRLMDGIRRRHGANLPHWTKADGYYFVTFRQADSIPITRLKAFKEEFAAAIRVKERTLKRPLTETEQRSIKLHHRRAIEAYLDEGRGTCLLAKDCHAHLLQETMLRQADYTLEAWSIMPNHVHAVVHIPCEDDLAKVMHGWKSYSSTMINRAEGRRGRFWQSESFDHLIRHGDSFVSLCRYVLDNPTKANLPEWKWVGCSPRVGELLRNLGFAD